MPLRVALYSGIVVRHDAVSESLRVKLEILRRLKAEGAPVETVVFTYASDLDLPEVRPVVSVARLAGLEEFWSADVHVFEFGMYYDLVDALYLLPPNKTSLVIDHNTTPPELVELPEVKLGCQRALLQRHNLREATLVACVSEYTTELVGSIGVPAERTSVLHLPPAHAGALRGRVFGPPPRPVEVLFVGRLVHAKGVLDLLSAVAPIAASGRCRLRLVGNPTFSDPDVLARVEAEVASSGGSIELVTAVDPSEMVRLYESSDLLVIPSYHEGYCVPVIEALSAGCHVVAYDGSNLPHVVGGLGQLVSTGDVEGLADAVERFVDRAEESARRGAPIVTPTVIGDLDESAWLARVAEHLSAYSAAHFEASFLQLLLELGEASGNGLDPALAKAIEGRRAQLVAA